eukprot:CAMPEP_0170546776 /NCGR_PEP_ID=MMETSP0211-20121228/5105_1 /TAXON_ID=311385 /ORGANISM="Pseudokeronopsis sp., Strain OXSARD2" /LENGTH=292 /DNA_ID=CAMNT_0010851399 /DNA_START=1285 /DNA_END=2159 /DNA_ORIENTATION=-
MLVAPQLVVLEKDIHLWLSHIVKVAVRQALSSVQSIFRIHLKHSCHEVQSLFGKLPDVSLLQGLWLVHCLRELVTDEPGIPQKLISLLLCQRSHYFLDAKQLVDFGFSWKQRLPIAQLSHDTTNGPDIHFFGIVVAKEEFWGSVPSGGNVVCERAALIIEYSCKTKVTDPQFVGCWIDEEVFRLDISVDDVVSVAELDGFEELVNELTNCFRIQSIGPFLQNFQKILLHVLKHKIQPLFPLEGFFQLDNVILFENSQHFYFPESSFFNNLIFIRLFELLYCHYFTGFLVFGL